MRMLTEEMLLDINGGAPYKTGPDYNVILKILKRFFDGLVSTW